MPQVPSQLHSAAVSYLIEQRKSRCGTASAPEPHPCCILHAAPDGHVNRSTRPRAATRRSLLQMFVKKIPTYVLGDRTPITVNASAPQTIHVKRSRVVWERSTNRADVLQRIQWGQSGLPGGIASVASYKDIVISSNKRSVARQDPRFADSRHVPLRKRRRTDP